MEYVMEYLIGLLIVIISTQLLCYYYHQNQQNQQFQREMKRLQRRYENELNQLKSSVQGIKESLKICESCNQHLADCIIDNYYYCNDCKIVKEYDEMRNERDFNDAGDC